MAVVWRALDRKLHREVALKEIREEVALHSDGIARFRHEAEAIARLSHPNVVAFYDAADEGPRTLLVMELVKGEPLARFLEKRPPLRTVVEILEKATRGVHHAHEQGVIHRDLKPGNILLDQSGEPKVSDFGLAHLSGDLVTTLTKTGAVLGTPAYMAPEQARGAKSSIDRRTDVYALGATLYEALAGRPPFRGDSIHAVVHDVIHKEPEPPRILVPGVPLDLQTIALKCLAKEQQRRYETALEVADELRRWLDGKPIRARPPSATEVVALWIRRNQRFAVLLAAFAVAAATAIAAFGFRIQEYFSRESAVEAELAHAREGPVNGSTVDRIVALTSPRTIEILIAAVNRETDQLAAVTADVYIAAKVPDEDEARLGEKPLEGLEGAVKRLMAAGQPDPGDVRVLGEALRRIEDRDRRTLAKAGDAREPNASVVIGLAQSRRQSPGVHHAALVAIEALGRIADRAAVKAIARFLALIEDEQEACLAGEALIKIGGDEAGRAVMEKQQRLGSLSVFYDRMAPLLARSAKISSTPGALTAKDLKDRGIDRASIKDFDGAIADLTSSIALDPKDPFAWYNRALVHFEKRELDASLADASRAVKLKPEDGGFLSFRGNVRRLRGDLDDALEDLDKAIELEPRRVTSLVYRGQARRAAGDFPGAIADLTSAIAIDGGSVAAWSNRGFVKKQAKDYQGALADWNHVLQLKPHDAITLVNKGVLEKELGEYAAAIDDLSRAIDEQTQSPDPYIARGMVYLHTAQTERGLADFETAIEMAPNAFGAWQGRALARKDLGDLKEALEDMGHACKLSPRTPNLWCDSAGIRVLLGDLAGARKDLDQALKLDSKHVLALTNRGVVRRRLGDLKGAIADTTRALKLDPKNTAALGARIDAFFDSGDYETALADAERLIGVAPADAESWLARARVRLELDDLSGAIDDVSRVIELTPKSAPAWAERSRLRLGKGETEAALDDASHALAIDPRSVRALATRGQVRIAQGDVAGGRTDLERVLEIAPVSSDANVARLKLAEIKK
jgi:tetratricopeptide (TPR) repeat protein